MSLKRIGPITVETGPGQPATDKHPSRSPIYRNAAGAERMPDSLNGATTLYELFQRSAEAHADHACLGWRPVDASGTIGAYKFLTYRQVQTKAREVACALVAAGVSPGSSAKVGVFAPNRLEWMLCIRAVELLGHTIVPIYDSLGEAAVEYICNHSELSLAFVDPAKLAKLAEAAPKVAQHVRTIVCFGHADTGASEAIKKAGIDIVSWDDFIASGSGVELKVSPPKPDDLALLMYTSGTTGTPKGVMITHRAIVAACAGAHVLLREANIEITERDRMLSFLTLAHVYDRVMEEFVLSVGATIGYWQGDVKKIMDDCQALKPTLFIAVPRVLERVADAVEGKLAKGPAAARVAFGAVYHLKLALERRGVPSLYAGLGLDHVIFRKVRAAMGGRVRYIISGGAPLAAHVMEFCSICLAPVLQGYGLTETCATSFITLPDAAGTTMAGTVGPPLAATEFRFESVPELKYDAEADPPAGEILIRGPMVTPGYYKDAEKTKSEFDEEGFFHSGDIGTITPQGALKIVDRKKNIFKLAQGEYIAVEQLESQFSRNEAVEMIWVYGNSHESSLVAVVVPKESWLQKYSGAEDEMARRDMLKELERTGKEAKLKGFELIKAVHLEPNVFTVEDDLITPSMKLKRPQLQRKYQQVIDDMYAQLKTNNRRR